jgi:hypothetical protein
MIAKLCKEDTNRGVSSNEPSSDHMSKSSEPHLTDGTAINTNWRRGEGNCPRASITNCTPSLRSPLQDLKSKETASKLVRKAKGRAVDAVQEKRGICVMITE